jgi:hypothetical protein
MATFPGEPVNDDQLEEETPVEDVEEETGEPELVRVRLNGQTLMVTADVADAIQAREDAFQKRFSEQGAELGRLRKQPEQPKQAEPDPADEDLEFYTSPSKAWAKREARLREEFGQALTERENLTARREVYWKKFYTENDEFVGREKLVNAVVASEYDRLSQLSPEDAQEQLAITLHGMLGTEPGVKSRKTSMTTRQVTAERSANPPRKGQPQAASPKTVTLSDGIRQRAEARRKALYNQKSE